MALVRPAQSQVAVDGEGYATIPIDEQDRDVRLLRSRQTTSRTFERVTRRSFARAANRDEQRFLVGIDFSRLPSRVISRARRARTSAGTLAQDNAETLETKTEYSNHSFTTTYDQFDASLTCYWKYNIRKSKMIAALTAKAAEERLERRARAKRLGRTLPEEPANRSLRALNTVPQATEHGLILKSREFKKAGRPCIIEIVCTPVQRANCQDGVIDALVKGATVVRAGN
jgi:hypothetical protein